MTKQNRTEMKNYVIQAFAKLYKCDLKESKRIVENSSFIVTLSNDPEYVMHYDDEYWAKKIKKEQDTIIRLKNSM